jgi:hypothetical protein
MSASDLVEQLTAAIVSVVDVPPSEVERTTSTFRKTIAPICERFFSTSGKTTGAPKLNKDGTVKVKKTRTPSTKISAKNGYHFYVAATMPAVLAEGVEPKLRMKRIAAMWKEVSDVDEAPFKSAATAFNEKAKELVAARGNPTDKDSLSAIKAEAQAYAVEVSGLNISADHLDDADEVSTTVSTVVAPAAVPAPVPAAVPAAAAAPAQRRRVKQ